MPNQIYFIDSKLNDYQTIVNSLSSTDIYYIIDSSSDGLSQMSNILSNYSNLDSIHVYSHGDIGSLNIGNTVYDNTNISNYKIELENIGKSLSSTGDILLYGCNVGQDEVGKNFINQIAQYTQADVAASDDLTGNKVLGGDWDLEVKSGVVETKTFEVKDYQSVMLDDHSDTTTDATALTLGTATEGNKETYSDVDYFKIDLVAGKKYLFEMNDVTLGTSGDAYLELYSGTTYNSFLASGHESNNKAQISYIATTSGTYYLKADTSFYSGTGTYTIKASTIADDYSDLRNYATSLELGTAKNGNIEVSGDVDYFKVDLKAGQKYLFEMNDVTLGTSGDAYLNLYDSNGYNFASGYEGYSNNKAQISYIATTSGTYYLKANTYYYSSTGKYTVKATAVADDHSDTITGATLLTPGIAINGNIEVAGDTDYFKVALTAGQKYLFSMTDVTLGTSGYAYLSLYDSTNPYSSSIKYGYESNGVAQFSYTATTAGTYYLQANSDSSSSGKYTVKATAIADDHSDTTTSAIALTLGTPKNGNIEAAGDVDYFKVDLVVGKKYLFEMNDLTLGTSGDAYLNLQNSNGYNLAYGYEGYSNNKAIFSYTATTSGTYYLKASSDDDSIGKYTVKATAVTDDFGNTTTTAKVLALETTLNGNIEVPQDVDYFKVSLTAGKKYYFEMKDLTLGTSGTAYLNLYNSSNSYLSSGYESNGVTKFSYTATTTGTYYLKASSDYDSIGTYTVKASTNATPELTNLWDWNTNQNTLYLAQGTKINVNLQNYVYDENGHKVTITLNTNSLQSGLTFNNGIISGTTTSTVNGSLKITLKDALGATNTQTITVKTVNPSLIGLGEGDFHSESSDINHILGSTATFTKPTASNSVSFFSAYDDGFDQISINKGTTTLKWYENDGNTIVDDIMSGFPVMTDKVGSDGFLDTFVNPWATEQFTYGAAKAVTSINGVATPKLYKVDVVSTVITPGTVEKSDDWWDASWYSYHNINDTAITSLKTLQTLLTTSKETVWMEGDKKVVLLTGGNVVSYEKDGSLDNGNGTYYNKYAVGSTVIGKWTNSTTTGKDGYLKVTLNTGEVSAFKIDSTNTLVQTSLPAKGYKETLEWYYGVDLATFSKYYNSILTSKSITINEDTNKILKMSDFYFENNYWFNRLKITQLETKGSLKLNGVDVTLNQEISSYDISSGKLVYTPVKDAYANSYSNFKYQIYYSNNYSTKTYTTTFDVKNVADVRSSSSTYTLSEPDVVLTLTGTTAINGTGNTLNNTITGNTANNILNGKAGNDILKGGLGNDTLYGELGNDMLNGEAGADIMLGGAGNDIYYVDNALDKVYETTTTTSTIDATGIDIVNSSISYTLTSFVENLTLTGTTAINGTGNGLNNTITGNSGANTLNGGLGNDILKGGTGKDIFVFNTKLGSTNVDKITDFNVTDDTIHLENLIFTKLTSTTFNSTTKVLNTGNFVSTTDGKAKDVNDYLVYNKGTGQLFYDVDGNGAGAAIQFATIENKAALTYADFTVI